MAKNNNLTDFLTDVANAIREKDGSTGTINPQDFSDKIKAIQTGVDTSDGNIEPTTVLKGYKGYAKGVAVNGAIETYDGTVEDVIVGGTVMFNINESHIAARRFFNIYDGTDTSGILLYSITDSTSAIPNSLNVNCSTGHLCVYASGRGSTYASVDDMAGGVATTYTGPYIIITVTSNGTINLSVDYDA